MQAAEWIRCSDAGHTETRNKSFPAGHKGAIFMTAKKAKTVKNNKNQVIWSWSLSYFGIVLLPVIFGGLLYGLAMGTVEEKSKELHQLLAEERKNLLVGSCEELNRYTNQIFSSNELAQVSGIAYTTEQKNYYAREVQKLLKRTVAECDWMDHILLYLPQNNSFLSESWQFSAGKSDEFFRRKTGFRQEYFYWLMAGDSFNQLHICDTGGDKPELFYIRALSNGLPYQEQKAILLLYINQERLEDMLTVEGINFYLEDTNGNRYAILSGEERYSIEELQGQRLSEGELLWKGNTCMFHSFFGEYGLSFYHVQQDVRFIRELRGMKQLLVWYCVLCVVFGFLLTYLRSRKNYQPIGGLLALLEKAGEQPDGKDTWSGLQDSVRGLVKKYQEGQVQQRENNRRIEEERLRQLLLAGKSFSYTEFEKQAVLYAQPVYRVIHIDTVETGNGYREIVQSMDDIQMLHFIIGNVMAELVGEGCCCQGTTIDNELYFLFQYDAAQSGRWEEIGERLGQVRSFFESSYSIPLFFNSSEELSEVEKLPDGLREARYLAQFRNEVGADEVLFVFDRENKTETERNYIREAKAKLEVLRLIEENQIEEAANLLRRQFPDKADKIEKGKKQRERRREADDLVEAAVGYIREHYTDPQLTAGYLAEQLEVHSSKLSREFKQRTGTGVLEYIGLIRLEAAKQLLAAGHTVGDTAVAVGYYNSRPLIRLFQEHEGITPSQYKK